MWFYRPRLLAYSGTAEPSHTCEDSILTQLDSSSGSGLAMIIEQQSVSKLRFSWEISFSLLIPPLVCIFELFYFPITMFSDEQ